MVESRPRSPRLGSTRGRTCASPQGGIPANRRARGAPGARCVSSRDERVRRGGRGSVHMRPGGDLDRDSGPRRGRDRRRRPARRRFGKGVSTRGARQRGLAHCNRELGGVQRASSRGGDHGVGFRTVGGDGRPGGAARDREEWAARSSGISWTSDLDGNLGQGARIAPAEAGPSPHRCTQRRTVRQTGLVRRRDRLNGLEPSAVRELPIATVRRHRSNGYCAPPLGRFDSCSAHPSTPLASVPFRFPTLA